MIGAVTGDVIGSVYEISPIKILLPSLCSDGLITTAKQNGQVGEQDSASIKSRSWARTILGKLSYGV